MRYEQLIGSRGLAIHALVPETRPERMRGLLGRSSLGPREGLLLERARSIHTFGMRFPILVGLLDEGLTVLRLLVMRPRRLLLPRPGVRHVLELGEHADLRPGDRLLRSRLATRSVP